jgi:glyoxylate utilization-related uncharacterized protein
MQPKKYSLPGLLVEVHKPFGDTHYYALLTLKGMYPGENRIARNAGRREYVYLLEGEATLTVNGTSHILRPKMHQLLKDGDRYSLQGEGQILVFVEDQINGSTVIE